VGRRRQQRQARLRFHQQGSGSEPIAGSESIALRSWERTNRSNPGANRSPGGLGSEPATEMRGRVDLGPAERRRYVKERRGSVPGRCTTGDSNRGGLGCARRAGCREGAGPAVCPLEAAKYAGSAAAAACVRAESTHASGAGPPYAAAALPARRGSLSVEPRQRSDSRLRPASASASPQI
jgi:hypothetical protein